MQPQLHWLLAFNCILGAYVGVNAAVGIAVERGAKNKALLAVIALALFVWAGVNGLAGWNGKL